MKTLILVSGLLFGSLTGLAQTLFRFPSFPADLKQYLSLTDTQVNAIVQLTSDYNQMVFDKQQRIFQVQNEIADENRKDPLDPMALGLRYAEIEWIRRDLGKQLSGLRDKIRASLTDAQRAKVKTLDDARNLQPVISQAECENLLDNLPFPGNIIPAIGIFDPSVGRPFIGFRFACFAPSGTLNFPAELRQYLSLSSDQANAITVLNQNNQQLTNLRQQRIGQLQIEIADETRKDPLDPMALGVRYAETESIRRDINNDLATLRDKAKAVLNDMQRAKLGALDDMRKLQPLIGEAECENLLDPVISAWFDTSGPYVDFLLGPATTFSCGSTGLFVRPFP